MSGHVGVRSWDRAQQGRGVVAALLVLLASNEAAAQPRPRPVPVPPTQQNLTPQQTQAFLLQSMQLLWYQQQIQARAIWQMQPQANPVQPNLPLQQNPLPRPQNARVLFIGDSCTSANKLPEVLAALAQAGNVPPLNFDSQLVDGASLQQHVKDGQAVRKIQQGKWDLVILQEQAQATVMTTEATLQSAQDFNQEIAKVGARPLYLQTWASRNALETQVLINAVCKACARHGNGGVAPVGNAFVIAQLANPNVALYQKDGKTPTPAGTYLAACVLYAAIYGQSPVGLPARVGQGDQMLVNLQPATAQLLQAAALEAVTRP